MKKKLSLRFNTPEWRIVDEYEVADAFIDVGYSDVPAGCIQGSTSAADDTARLRAIILRVLFGKHFPNADRSPSAEGFYQTMPANER